MIECDENPLGNKAMCWACSEPCLKKVFYRSGAETEDSIILEFLAEIPRMFRPTLFYDIWLIVPKTEAGEANTWKNWNPQR